MMKNLKSARQIKGLTQEELADIVGITRASIARYEAGDREPSNAILVRMADTLETSTDFLLGRTETTAPIPEPTTLAAHETDGEPPVSDEEMDDIITKAYNLLQKRKKEQSGL